MTTEGGPDLGSGTKRETKGTGREGRVDGAQRNVKWNGQGENSGRKRATKQMGQRGWASEARRNGKRNGRKANVGRQGCGAAGQRTDWMETWSELCATMREEGPERARNEQATSGIWGCTMLADHSNKLNQTN